MFSTIFRAWPSLTSEKKMNNYKNIVIFHADFRERGRHFRTNPLFCTRAANHPVCGRIIACTPFVFAQTDGAPAFYSNNVVIAGEYMQNAFESRPERQLRDTS